MGFFRQEYWSGLPFPPPGDLPGPGTEPESPTSPALAGGFFITELPGKPRLAGGHPPYSNPDACARRGPWPCLLQICLGCSTSVPRKFSLLSRVSALLFLEHREIFCSMIVLEDATGPGPPDKASRRAVYTESKRSAGSRAGPSVFPSCWGRWVSRGRITKSHFKNRPEKSESRDNQRFETHTPPSKPWQESKNKSGGASRPSSFETVAVADFENGACPRAFWEEPGAEAVGAQKPHLSSENRMASSGDSPRVLCECSGKTGCVGMADSGCLGESLGALLT